MVNFYQSSRAASQS